MEIITCWDRLKQKLESLPLLEVFQKIVNMSFYKRNHPKENNVRQIRQCNGMFVGPGLTVNSMIVRIESQAGCSTGAGTVVAGRLSRVGLASLWTNVSPSFPLFSPPGVSSDLRTRFASCVRNIYIGTSTLHPPRQVPAAVLFFQPGSLQCCSAPGCA